MYRCYKTGPSSVRELGENDTKSTTHSLISTGDPGFLPCTFEASNDIFPLGKINFCLFARTISPSFFRFNSEQRHFERCKTHPLTWTHLDVLYWLRSTFVFPRKSFSTLTIPFPSFLSITSSTRSYIYARLKCKSNNYSLFWYHEYIPSKYPVCGLVQPVGLGSYHCRVLYTVV